MTTKDSEKLVKKKEMINLKRKFLTGDIVIHAKINRIIYCLNAMN